MKDMRGIGIILTLLLGSVVALSFAIQESRAQTGTIYIRADGSVDPPSAPIQPNGNIYSLTDDIYDSAIYEHDLIVVERDNIVLDGAGFSVYGTGNGTGIDLSQRSGVTVKNMKMTWFTHCIYLSGSTGNIVVSNTFVGRYFGVYLSASSSNSIHSNSFTDIEFGVYLSASSSNSIHSNSFTDIITGGGGVGFFGSSDNSLVENTFTNNNIAIRFQESSNHNSIVRNTVMGTLGDGIWLYESSNNLISENYLTQCEFSGVVLAVSSNYNTLYGNTITESGVAIHVYASSNYNRIVDNTLKYNSYGVSMYDWMSPPSYNEIYHNNFVENTEQARTYASTNVWDDGYPSGGNYWSDYIGTDEYSGSNQNQPGSDGIGDTPYLIYWKDQDRYPLMSTHIPPPPPPDFSISVSPTSRTITPGQSATYAVTVTSVNGFNAEVELSYSISPSSKKVSAAFDSPSVTPPPDGSIISTLTVSAKKSAETNFYTIEIMGFSQGEVRLETVTLAIAWYELYFEIDYMEGHRPTDSVLSYIENYYISSGISLNFFIDDEVPCDPNVALTDFWAIENVYNNLENGMGDDWARGDKRSGIYFSKWKWILFGSTYEKPWWHGFCVVPVNDEHELEWGTSTSGGNYLFIADKANDDWADDHLLDEEKVETVVLMHEMGHSIGILNLRFDVFDEDGDGDRLEYVEFYDLFSQSVMAILSSKNCNADPIRYSAHYWLLKNMEDYEV